MISKKLYNKTNKILQWIVIIAAFGFLAFQIYSKNQIFSDLHNLVFNFSSFHLYIYLCVVLLLMPINWFIESVKWRFLIKKKESISMSKAIKAVISGISISSITPNRVGEFVARLFVLKKTRFWEGVFITIIGSFSQTIITLFLGISAILVFTVQCEDCYLHIPFFSWGSAFFVTMGIFACVGLLIVYFKFHWIHFLIPKSWRRIRFYSLVLKQFTEFELSIALILSLVRYLIFSAQFVILLHAFQIEIDLINALFLVFIIFFINTLNPSIALLELGVRGSIAVFVIKYYFEIFLHSPFEYELEAFLASGLLWFINIVIPAFVGLFFINKLNFFRFSKEKDESPNQSDIIPNSKIVSNE